MTKRFFRSDDHIGHKLVSVIRMHPELGPRPEISELDPALVAQAVKDHARIHAENWDHTVGPDDTVFMLGDIGINPRRDRVFDWIRDRPGKKFLIAGNHDEVAGFHSKALTIRQRPEWAETFAGITDFAFLKLNGKRVALSHYPYDGEGGREFEGGDRLTEVRLRDEGVPLLHGHTHAKGQTSVSAKGTPQFHVGADAWNLKPVPEAAVLEWLEWL